MREHAAAPEPTPREAAPEAPRGRAETVLALQRRAGNAATGRWLGRQATATFSKVYATKLAGGSEPAPAADPVNPKIVTVGAPAVTHPAGGYEWYVRYELPKATSGTGWMIQELWQQSSSGLQDHLWEAWKVGPNSTLPMAATSPAPGAADPPGVYDDRFRTLVVNPDPRGWSRHLGIVRFYPGPLPPQFFKPNSPPDATSYDTHDLPSGWTGQGTRHDCYMEWSDTGPAPRFGFMAFGGTQEWRAGRPVTGKP